MQGSGYRHPALAFLSGLFLLALLFPPGALHCFAMDSDPENGVVVITEDAQDVTHDSATLAGELRLDAGEEVFEYGFYWSTDTDPVNTGIEVIAGYYNDYSPHGYNYLLEGLDPDTEYYYVAYALNLEGYHFGDVLSFMTLPAQPVVQTLEATGITSNSAFAHGEIVSAGGTDITARGVFWGDNPEPKINGTRLDNGQGGTGSFQLLLEELDPNSDYYYAAFAETAEGEIYFDGITEFTTLAELPLVNTMPAQSVTSASATLRGDVFYDGGAEISDMGVVWATSPDPVSDGQQLSAGPGGGYFELDLDGFQPQTLYYFAAYAVNQAGTSYGNILDFETAEPDPEPEVFVPNAFAPSGLEKNREFLPRFNLPPVMFSMTIINRWGGEVFKSNDPELGWDGRVDGRDAPSGTYIYRVDYRFANGEQGQLTGVVTLVR